MDETPTPPSAPQAWSLRQGLLVGLVRAVVTSAALGVVFGRVGWPVAGAALGAATTAVEAWARRRQAGRWTLLLAAAWTALAGAWAVGWGQLQGIYAVALVRSGSPGEARTTALAAVRGLADARWREDGLWYEALPWLERSGASPRTPLLILAVAAGLTALLRLARHAPWGPRQAAWARVLGSPLVLPPLGLLLALLTVQAVEREALPALTWRVLVGGVAKGDKDHLLAAFGLALLAGFMLPLAASLSDLAARRPRGADEAPPPGPWAARALLPALLGLWVGMVTVPARGWPSTREEGLTRARQGTTLERVAGLELLRQHVDLEDVDVQELAFACARDDEPAVRAAALQLLAAAPFRADIWELEHTAALDPDPGVRACAWMGLRWGHGVERQEEVRQLLVSRALVHADPGVRADAYQQMDLFSQRGLSNWIRHGVKDPVPAVRAAAIAGLHGVWEEEERAGLVALARGLVQSDPDPRVRRNALEAGSTLVRSLDEMPELRAELGSADPVLRGIAAWGLVNVAWSDERAALLLAEEVLAGGWQHAAEPLCTTGRTAAAALPRLRAKLAASRDPGEREALERVIDALERY